MSLPNTNTYNNDNNMPEATANTMIYGGAASAVLFGLNASDVAAVGGLVVGALGLLIGAWFQYQRDKRDKAEHLARMTALKERGRLGEKPIDR